MAKSAAKAAKPEIKIARKTGVLKGGPALTEFAPGRWAVILTTDSNKDQRDEVIDIKQMAPGAVPDLYDVEKSESAGNYSVEQVPAGVIIGMRRGGKFEAVIGFGWRDAEDKVAHGSPVGSGVTRVSDMGAAASA